VLVLVLRVVLLARLLMLLAAWLLLLLWRLHAQVMRRRKHVAATC
jgi:hypothetical protein